MSKDDVPTEMSVEVRNRIRDIAEMDPQWRDQLYTKEDLNAQGYTLGWVPEELHSNPDAYPVGGMVPDPYGGPDQVIVKRPNPYQVVLIPWDKIPRDEGMKPQ